MRRRVCTHSPVSRTFSLCDVETSRTRMAQGVCSVHVAYLNLAFSVLMFHPPSLLFPHGHFDTTLPSAPSSSSFTQPKSAGQAHFRTSAEEFGYLADPTHSTGCKGDGHYQNAQRKRRTSDRAASASHVGGCHSNCKSSCRKSSEFISSLRCLSECQWKQHSDISRWRCKLQSSCTFQSS